MPDALSTGLVAPSVALPSMMMLIVLMKLYNIYLITKRMVISITSLLPYL